MSSASVPTQTAQYQQMATGIWGSPQATALALPLLKPALGNLKSQQAMLLGVQQGDPGQTAAFFGLPSNSSTADIGAAMKSQMGGYHTPTPTSSNPPPPPTKTAAQGGIMALGNTSVDPRRKFAAGSSTNPPKPPKPTPPPKPTSTPLTTQQKASVQEINKAIQNNTVTQAQIDQLNSIEQSTGRNVSPYSSTGTTPVKDPTVAKSVDAAAKAYQSSPTNPNSPNSQILKDAAAAGITQSSAYINKAGYTGTANYDPLTGKFDVTNPYFNQATDLINKMGTPPSQFGQATDAYNQAISGLAGKANYSPEQVAAQNVAAQQASSQGYSAATMNAPSGISAQGYNAAQMQGGPNVNAVNATAAQMRQPGDVSAVNVGTSQMAGPQSWTSAGTSQQYMDPYIQNVLRNQEQLSNQQFAQQQNQLKSQATGSKAYGGSRAQLAQDQAQFNQNLALQNMTQQGLSNAYQQGLSQFNTAQGQSLQAGQANLSAAQQSALANQAAGMTAQQLNQQTGLQTGQANLSAQQQAILANQAAGMSAQQLNQLYGQGGFQANQANTAAQNAQMQQYVQNALDAAKNNYAGELTAAQQNQIAQNAAAQFTSSAANQAQLTNAQLGTNASIANASNALSASQGNQTAGLQANQQGIGALSGIGNMASGLASTGTQIGNYNTGLVGLLGQAGGTWQTLGSNIANQNNANATSVYGSSAKIANQGVDTLQGMGSGTAGYQVGASKTTP
jgi:hypothetical protein